MLLQRNIVPNSVLYSETLIVQGPKIASVIIIYNDPTVYIYSWLNQDYWLKTHCYDFQQSCKMMVPPMKDLPR